MYPPSISVPTLFWTSLYLCCLFHSFLPLQEILSFVVTTVYPSIPLLMDIQALCNCHQQGGGCVCFCVRVSAGVVYPEWQSWALFYAFFLPVSLPSALSNSCTTSVSFPIFPHLCQHLVLSESSIFANLLDIKWYLIFLLCFSYYL